MAPAARTDRSDRPDRAEGTRRVGRPRADASAAAGDPREEILEAAAGLFTTVGYARTTTRAVAAAAGLRQPSLFHYFATKEDLLAELLDRTVAPAVGFLTWLGEQEAPPEVRLCALAWRDVDNLCSGPHNLGALQLLPEARGERFADFWVQRARLRAGYAELVAACGAVDDVELTTSLVFGLVESVITWFERGGRRSPGEVADEVSLAVLRLATGRGGEQRRVRTAAAALVAAPSAVAPPDLA